MELLTCRASVDTAQQSAEVLYKTGILYQAPNAGDLEGIEQSQEKKKQCQCVKAGLFNSIKM